MLGHSKEIDEALAGLGSRVADQLSADGWSRILLDEHSAVTLTRPTRNGVTAVVEIARTSFQWPDDWPVEVEVALGVGYEPALDLMPLLTVHPRAVLIDCREYGRANSFAVSLNGLETVAHAAHQIVHFVSEHASATTQDFPDAAAIDAQLERRIAATLTRSDAEHEGEDDDPGASGFATQLRLVVLAAMGRHDEVRALLATCRAGQADESINRADRRFIRQLTRWLDAGGPVAPPIEDTLAQLPRRPRPPRPSWSDARASSKANKEALDAARAKSEGMSLDQLKELIAAEYLARGIEIAPSVVDLSAEMLQIERQPFGRARRALKVIRMLASIGGDMIRVIKHASEDDPEWLQPPDRAAYPMIAGRDRHTSVELDAAAHDWLERVRTEAPQRMGHWVLIDVWLTHEDPAAALFDEDVFVRGRLTSANGAGPGVLEISMPERHGADATT